MQSRVFFSDEQETQKYLKLHYLFQNLNTYETW